jgi:hypothetical protein
MFYFPLLSSGKKLFVSAGVAAGLNLASEKKKLFVSLHQWRKSRLEMNQLSGSMREVHNSQKKETNKDKCPHWSEQLYPLP